MDEETIRVILELQINDLQSILEKSKGKGVVGRVYDADYACRTQMDEFKQRLTFLEDLKLSRSINQAIHRDSSLVSLLFDEETRSYNDRKLAHQLAGLPVEALPNTTPIEADFDSLASQIASFSVNNDNICTLSNEQNTSNDPGIGSSLSVMRYAPMSKKTILECVACMENIIHGREVKAPCAHYYCRTCIIKLFEQSTTDESLFPARCCRQKIPIQLVSDFLRLSLIHSIKQKAIEFGTVNRVYCSVASCAVFIPPNRINNNTAICPSCLCSTCSQCKKSAHSGDCPEDEGIKSALAAAQEAGWQRCYNCRTMVELTFGCNHITCRCRAEFCYTCGLKWKTCKCSQWDEERLYTRATQLVRRQNEPRHRADGAAGEVLALRVAQQAARLRERHECRHGNWAYTEGAHRCENCQFWLPKFILECRACHLQSCVRCARNRI